MGNGRHRALAGLLALLCSACGGQARHGLRSVQLPDLSSIERAARVQVQESYASLQAKVSTPGISNGELSGAYADLGRLLMAAEYNDRAVPCFLNAIALDSHDGRWPYYLAHVYRRTGDLATSRSYFERTVALRPDDLAALWWLASTELDLGRFEDADAHFGKALAAQPGAWAATYGIGRTALSRKDYPKAVEYLERTLTMNPRALAVHYPLGVAYRALGRTADAEAHLRQRSDEEIRPPDPLMAELGGLLQSSAVYQSRALQAEKSGAWATAAADFRRAVELDPDNAAARLGLGIVLYKNGSKSEGIEQVGQALRAAPRLPRAHYVAGMLLAMSGRDREAIERFTDAVALDASFLEARISLAQALQRTERPREALAQYQEILARVPGDAESQFGSAVTLIRLRRYEEARARLTEGANGHPDDARLGHALARLLAAAPDGRVRDGARARSIAEAMFTRAPTIEGAETMAMALAELGQFGAAMEWQRRAIAAVEEERQRDLARQMDATLRLYEHGQPCRTPWRSDDPIFFPRPPADLQP